METYDSVDQRFVSFSHEKLEGTWSANAAANAATSAEPITVPPMHKLTSTDTAEPLVLTVYLNKKKPLSEPKWCRTNSADDWLIEQFGSRKAGSETGWKGKLEIVDPDPVSGPALFPNPFLRPH